MRLSLRHSLMAFVICLLMVFSAYAQTAAPELRIALGEQQLRFAPTRSFQEMRLAVVNHVGETVFSQVTTDAEFNWNMRAGNGEALAPGLYSYALTVQYTADLAHRHAGHFIIEKGSDQVWLTAQDGAEVSGTALNVARTGRRSVAGLRTTEDKAVKRDVSGREIVDDQGNKLPDAKDDKDSAKAVKQEKAALLGTLNKVAKFDATGSPANVTDSTIIETGGRVGIGTITPQGALHVVSSEVNPLSVEMSGVPGVALTAQMDNFGGGGTTGGSGFLGRAANGSRLAPTNVAAGERLGFNVFGGYAGGGFRHVAAINAHVGTGSISATSLPSFLNFMTTPDGSVARLERLRIDQNGNVGIGTIAPNTPLEVNGLLRSTRNGNAAQYLQLWGGDSASIRLTAQSTVAAEKPLLIQNLSGEVTPGVFNTIQFQVGTTAAPATKMIIDKDGNVGIGITVPTTKLYALSSTPGISAIYGESATGRGVWGKSTSSRGVYGESTSLEGVYGISSSGTGVTGASTSGSGVYGQTAVSSLTAGGVYGRGIGSGSIGVIGESNLDNAVGVFGLSTSSAGVGVYARNLSGGRALFAEGNVAQSLASNGVVKAMLYVDSNGTIVRCYNGITNSSTGGCGFTVTNPLLGVFRIDFGFPVSNRFVSVTGQYTSSLVDNNNVGANFRFFNDTSVEVFTFRADSSDTIPRAFMIILF